MKLTKDVPDVKASKKGEYLIPESTNFPDVDSFLPGDVVFQMTTSNHHPYSISRMTSVYKKWLGKDLPKLPFIYVVPLDRFDAFKYQQPMLPKKVEGGTFARRLTPQVELNSQPLHDPIIRRSERIKKRKVDEDVQQEPVQVKEQNPTELVQLKDDWIDQYVLGIDIKLQEDV